MSPQNSFIHAASYLPPPVALFGAAASAQAQAASAASSAVPNKSDHQDPSKVEADNNVVSSTMEELDMAETNAGRNKEKRKGKNKGKNSIPVQEAATSSSTGFDRDDFDEEKEFFETHCHWENCDKGDFGSQDALVKVSKGFILIFKECDECSELYFLITQPLSALPIFRRIFKFFIQFDFL